MQTDTTQTNTLDLLKSDYAALIAYWAFVAERLPAIRARHPEFSHTAH